MEERGIGVARARERRGVAECTTEREKEERKKERMTGGPHSVVVSIENET